MNELTVKSADLPALATEEVKQCVDLIGDAIQALKSKRNAAGHIGASKAVIDEMDAQIREYSAMKLKAEIELGKRTAAMPKQDRVKNLSPESRSVGLGKAEQLKSQGITSQRASDYERMARHESYVDQYIDRKLALGQTPTRHEVMREIKCADKPDTPTQAAKKAIKEIQDAKVVDIGSVETIKENQRVIEAEVAEKVYKELMDAAKCFLVYSEYGEDDVATVKKHIDSERLELLRNAIKSVSGYAFRIGQKIGGQF